LLVMWPVLYTDTGEAWKLKSRRARLEIGAAGVLAELVLAAFATLLWNFLPDGPLRAGVFMLATSTWVVTLAINASPFTRFDGYYLLSDWLNVPNLHERCFALGRWWLRERRFGFGDAPPEPLPPKLHRFLIGFAFVTWLYRFTLFLSIALLVFHFFFHALGLVLMCVEIGWFLALPILRELGVWRRRRGELRWNRQTLSTAVLAGLAALILLLPWQSAVHVPAVLGQAEAQTVYAPGAAQVVELAVHEGQQVAAGEVLARLRSPDLDHALSSAELEAARLQWEVEQQPFDEVLREQGPALRKRLETAREIVAGYKNEQARLIMRAPFAGRVVDVEPGLRTGEWLADREALLGIVGGGGVKGDAFVDEAQLARVARGQHVTFVANWPERGAMACKIGDLDRVNVTALDEPYVASVYGGGIASVKRADGTLAPLASVFRVRLGDCGTGGALLRELPGEAIIAGDAESLLARGIRRLASWLRREAAF
ncbi:MAG TPA: HlyD family efflux transporter periplasmic adaptor subunit, partial [Gammaproteobacteria bacterium]|nr:HlyD family efflux transporter periplasmic adaptor subunit [Gammaproteobacteria bacterium]